MTMRLGSLAVLVCVVLVCTGLSACSNVVGHTPDAVWVKQPMISLRSPETTAQRACGQYGRSAVRETVMSDPDSRDRLSPVPSGRFVPIHVFRCQ